jgi:hypothetical protein
MKLNISPGGTEACPSENDKKTPTVHKSAAKAKKKYGLNFKEFIVFF